MPDIAKCPGGDCPQKETCFRFTAMPNEFMQSYFVDPPNKGGECDYYWKVVEYPEEGLFHLKMEENGE